MQRNEWKIEEKAAKQQRATRHGQNRFIFRRWAFIFFMFSPVGGFAVGCYVAFVFVLFPPSIRIFFYIVPNAFLCCFLSGKRANVFVGTLWNWYGCSQCQRIAVCRLLAFSPCDFLGRWTYTRLLRSTQIQRYIISFFLFLVLASEWNTKKEQKKMFRTTNQHNLADILCLYSESNSFM